jgi:hypothetical protein
MNKQSDSADKLSLYTCAAESNMGEYIHQINGPALGIWQPEPDTYDDIAFRYLDSSDKKELKSNVLSILGVEEMPDANELIGNLYLGAIICRLKYLMVPEALPDCNDIHAMSLYYKKYYNSCLGKASASKFTSSVNKYCTGI